MKKGAMVLGLALTCQVSGCGASASSLCDAICECTGCSESEREDCIDGFEDAERDAEDEGCDDEYDALASCLDDNLECDDDRVDTRRCSDELEDVAECVDKPLDPHVIGGSPCGALKACCFAVAEAADGFDASVCNIYDDADEDACQELIDVAQQDPGPEVPPQCSF